MNANLSLLVNQLKTCVDTYGAKALTDPLFESACYRTIGVFATNHDQQLMAMSSIGFPGYAYGR